MTVFTGRPSRNQRSAVLESEGECLTAHGPHHVSKSQMLSGADRGAHCGAWRRGPIVHALYPVPCHERKTRADLKKTWDSKSVLTGSTRRCTFATWFLAHDGPGIPWLRQPCSGEQCLIGVFFDARGFRDGYPFPVNGSRRPEYTRCALVLRRLRAFRFLVMSSTMSTGSTAPVPPDSDEPGSPHLMSGDHGHEWCLT